MKLNLYQDFPCIELAALQQLRVIRFVGPQACFEIKITSTGAVAQYQAHVLGHQLAGFVLGLPTPLAINGAPAQMLHSVELDYPKLHKPGRENLLTRLLSLPLLTKLVLHHAKNLRDTRASSACPLEELVLVDCVDLDLAFMDDLLQLRRFGLEQRALPFGLVPWNVPKLARSRIERLDVTRRDLVWFHHTCDVFCSVSVKGYDRLKSLSLVAGDAEATEETSAVARRIEQLRELDSLTLHVSLPLCLPELQVLDLQFRHWAKFEPASTNLSALVLRSFEASADGSEDFRRLKNLVRLKLVGKAKSGASVSLWLPDATDRLELEHLRPAGVVRMRTLCMHAYCFSGMNPEEQARLKTSVKNLYLTSV
jgi:hypothetical protein